VTGPDLALFVQSPVLRQFAEIRHGSTKREFSSRETCRTEEARRFQSIAGIPTEYPIVHGDQCHTSTVAFIGLEAELPEDPDRDGRSWILETDGLVCARPGVTIAVYSADCVPILIYDPVKRVTAAIHAGWRGSLARISQVAVRRMVQDGGCDPEDLVAWIGPAAGPGYEVSPELADQFEEEFSEFPAFEFGWRNGRHVHLSVLNAIQMAAEGIPLSHVLQSGWDTLAPNSPFFSYRRDGGPTGRIMTSITILRVEDMAGRRS
jgi:YfiH family protein